MLRSRVRLYLGFVGENVRRGRKRRDLTQEALAEALASTCGSSAASSAVR